MWLETPVFREDLEYIAAAKSIPWDLLMDKTILLTGGTGLIGATLVSALVYTSVEKALNLKVLALVRDMEKARQQFKEQLKTGHLLLLQGDVEHLPAIGYPVHYIIHGACPTTSAYFLSNPVETIRTSVMGTLNLLELAKDMETESLVYLSSMEAYGEVATEQPLDESSLGIVNLQRVRSCYPESKRMCEAICTAYASEYGIRATSIRLAQTFGPGVAYEDKRVFAMIARCAASGQDIVLQTKGASRHPYLYTAQAVTAILITALKGEAGKTYNAANPATYCSIWEMAEMVATQIAAGKIQVVMAENGNSAQYPATSYLNLNTKAIEDLGWKPEGNLEQMYRRMMKAMV